MSIINDNIDLKNGKWGLCYDTSHGMHAAMSPGPDLDRMNEAMLTKFLPETDTFAAAKGQEIELDLYKWIRKSFSMASTEAIYGPGNPFAKQPELAESFWDFDKGLTQILFGMPTPSARRAHASR